MADNYPNPFNVNTTVRYQIPENGHVRLVIYNLLGKQVSTVIDQSMVEGEHIATFNCVGLEPGIYIYKLEFNNADSNYSLVNKMSVTR